MIEALSLWWKNWWRDWCALIGGMGWGLLIAVTFVLIDLAFEPTAKEKRLCSEAVDTVLTTKDPLELERAKFLVEQLRGCRVRL
jgi:hypothetical protein